MYDTAITWCPRGQSKCPTSNRCIRDSWFCDGDNDCADFSDESSALCSQYTRITMRSDVMAGVGVEG